MKNIYNFCPICQNKLDNFLKNSKRCASYPGHIFVCNTVLNNKIEDLISIKISYLPYDYTVIINYVENFTEISLHNYASKSGSNKIYSSLANKKTLKINKIISPDYPDLNNFKENINKYIIFI